MASNFKIGQGSSWTVAHAEEEVMLDVIQCLRSYLIRQFHNSPDSSLRAIDFTVLTFNCLYYNGQFLELNPG
jgi:hypothetical protein